MPKHTFKVGVVGNSGTGKASLLQAIQGQPFTEHAHFDLRNAGGSYQRFSTTHTVNSTFEQQEDSLIKQQVQLTWHSELPDPDPRFGQRMFDRVCRAADVIVLTWGGENSTAHAPKFGSVFVPN